MSIAKKENLPVLKDTSLMAKTFELPTLEAKP